jgi:hypothetical protein
LAEQARQRAARVVSAQQAAAVPPEGQHAAAAGLPVDAVGAAPGVAAAELPLGAPAEAAAERAVSGQRAAAPAAWVAPGAPALPLAVLLALAFRRDQVPPWPGPQPAAQFARAMAGLRTASP